ncbi:hypothetical protein [Paractinoplanes toevensis]|uniref:Uncharacterized protein n=1 Tax=Paractinoplanes toevensis TaxID=571911 RepID=A0A919W1X2_9ACTN|nr:hypothetical protein [Actinoplanes toevensis]GIM88895.1 hypothetical protein Ato02nite_006880 [Actinoplanes toevensis]
MNPIRTCPICTGTDDHPRHVIDVADTTIAVHMDCCATARNCDVCKAQLAGVGGVKGNPKGDRLREHLLTTGPGADQPGWTAPVVLEEVA